MASHCLPNGQLGTNELPVPNISGATITTFNPPTGMLRRGVVVFMHGLYVAAVAAAVPPSTLTGGPVGDFYFYSGSVYGNSLCTNLANDGWVVLAVTAQEDTFAGVPSVGVYNDVAADSGNGARYQASTLRTWDHVVQYIQQTYGSAWPIIAAGHSLGGWRATTIAQARPQTVKAVISHQPASVFENISAAFTTPVTFANLNWSGMNDTGTELNGITCPALIGYSTADTVVAYAGNTTAVSLVTGTLTLTSTSGFLTGGGQVLLTGLTGSTSGGRQTLSYTAVSGATLTGCAVVAGNGTITSGVSTAVQGYTDTICTNAVAAGKAVTRTQGTDPHSLSLGFAGAYYAGTATTITALNTLTTLQITATQAQTPFGSTQSLISGACSIQDTVGVWHAITYTGVTSPNLTGVVIAGTGSIATNAPICNTGTAITGGYTNMSIPYWVNTVIDPSYPKTY
jgi:pimeloyl-ACP methyl ester carboxylesterase